MSSTDEVFPYHLADNNSLKHPLSTRDTSGILQSQWKNPNDILSLLLILGPDVVWRALAQLAGETITPVVFSYGWVAYAVNTLVAAFGDGQMLPQPDYPVLVIGAKSGHVRTNQSWIIGRLLRDFDHSQAKAAPNLNKFAPDYEALRVTIFQVDRRRKAGVPTRDWLWYSGFAVMLAQIGISVIPLAIEGDWAPILVAVSGTTLSLLQGAVSQWREEKWACPTTGGWTTSLTRGNGSRNVMVILGNNHGLDLEILAGKSWKPKSSIPARAFLFLLALFWLVLLISVSGLRANAWYLLTVGLIGMIHNLVVAGAPRDPSTLGIHLNQIDIIADSKVSKVLQKTEDRYPLVGSSLISVFFPGGMRVNNDEKEFWSKAESVRQNQGLAKLAVKLD
ncbi:uncharacterized protein F4807DRAFT_235579 [Annulohypoxylon truncatum]|uniref:uncharacterized protein n=1 Tax=Annulohypoxylon truncatum TaxID=327061 RepID=UPI00200876DD|nr:uncharacterized protein F4807DRAFT_235579 [Annulohypoxylon truncatum]KAI1206298.1 hypothetical protein F4807DRAFT_235579 [Annulohypoxylon truncatum]